MDGLWWASEIEQDMNGCRLFYDKQNAIETIGKDMENMGYHLSESLPDDEGRDSVMMVFNKDKEVLRWIFAFIEIE